MKKLFKPIIVATLKKIGALYILRLRANAIKKYGWEMSAKKWQSIDADGNPIPWITYPMIDLLSRRVNKRLKVFEYGCGNSTLWWADKTFKVFSVEHNSEWYKKVMTILPENAKLELINLIYGGDYCKASKHNGPYEIIFIDGRDRVNCIKQSVNNLSEDGVIILDNSDRENYQEGIEFLKQHGYKQLPLKGLAPIINYISETSVFYRHNNCLDI